MTGFKKFSTSNKFSPKPSISGMTLAQMNSRAWESILKEVDGREKREMYKNNIVVKPKKK